MLRRYFLSLVDKSLEASVLKWKYYFTVPWNFYSFYVGSGRGYLDKVWEVEVDNLRQDISFILEFFGAEKCTVLEDRICAEGFSKKISAKISVSYSQEKRQK